MQYKRLLAGILSLVMLCSMVSTPAYAVEDAVQSDHIAVVTENQDPENDIEPKEVTVLSDQGGTGGTDGLDTDAPVIVTLKNNTQPQLQINITLREPDVENGGYAETTLNGVQFEVYYKDGGAFTPVENADGSILTVTSGTPASLSDGTYYLREIIPEGNPHNILDPDSLMNPYRNANPDKCEIDKSEKPPKLYFGPVHVTEQDDPIEFDIVNLTADVAIVAKTVDDKGEPLAGVSFTLRMAKSDSSKIEIGTATSDAQGRIVFDDVPYVGGAVCQLTEGSAPDGYCMADDMVSFPLDTYSPGTAITDKDKSDLQITCLPTVDFVVTQMFRNLWEYNFTQKDTMLPGTQVALFEKEENIFTQAITYQYLRMGTTDENGRVVFADLDQYGEYVAVEYSIPGTPEYDYLVPYRDNADRKYLQDDYTAEQLENGLTLTPKQLDEYNYVTKPAYTGTPATDPVPDTVTDTLLDVEHWTQLHIKKWVGDASYKAEGDPHQTDGQRPIDNARFALYREILPDGTATNDELAFDKDNLEKYTLVGNYSSGTLYDPDTGKRMDGWFGTDILPGGSNIVYWLVEVEPGIGAASDPRTQVTLIRSEDTQYTNKTQVSQGTSTAVLIYKKDTVTTETVEGNAADDPGAAQYAVVRIAKWADPQNGEDDPTQGYVPLGNVTFDLYLVDEKGNQKALLDTLTTGLDNGDFSGSNRTAWASSLYVELGSLMQDYGDSGLVWKDAEGNGYARVMLVETHAPTGYVASAKAYPMLLFFEKTDGDQVTVTFNDVYYVKEAKNDVPLADTIGPDTWPCYATRETESGDYESVSVPGAASSGQYRLVNLSVENYAVTVTQYGYDVTEALLGKTAAKLDEYFALADNIGKRTPLQGTLQLQRYDDNTRTWQDWAAARTEDGAETSTFTTDEKGYYVFPNGLSAGKYRLVEITAAPGYDKLYDGTALTGDEYYNRKAYYFTVTNGNCNLTLYAPAQQSLTLQKQKMDGTALQGAQFQLTGVDGTFTTGADGTVTISGIPTGEHKLSENGSDTWAYSTQYLAQYLASAYKDATAAEANGKTYALADFASGNGIFLGYETTQQGNDVVITNKVDLSDYGITDRPLKIQDPAKGSLTLKKEDGQTGKKLAGATFRVEYTLFRNWDEKESFTDETLAACSWITAANPTAATDANGTVTVTGLEPGIYKITEMTPPNGYKADPTPPVCGGHRRHAQDRDAERQNPCRSSGNVPELQSDRSDTDQPGEPGSYAGCRHRGGCRHGVRRCGDPPDRRCFPAPCVGRAVGPFGHRSGRHGALPQTQIQIIPPWGQSRPGTRTDAFPGVFWQGDPGQKSSRVHKTDCGSPPVMLYWK